MIGDCLGFPIEGQSREDLKRTAKDKEKWKLEEFISGIAMGTSVIRCVSVAFRVCFHYDL